VLLRAAPLQRPPEPAQDQQHGGEPEHHGEAERDGDGQEHRRGHEDAGQRARDERDPGGALRHPQRVDGRQAHDLPREGGIAPAARIQRARRDPQTDRVVAAHDRALVHVAAVASGARQRHEQRRQDPRPQEHRPAVAGRDAPVDDHADEHGHRGLGGLMRRRERRAERDVAAHAAGRGEENVARGHLGQPKSLGD
jgi:hypothetical protein